MTYAAFTAKRLFNYVGEYKTITAAKAAATKNISEDVEEGIVFRMEDCYEAEDGEILPKDECRDDWVARKTGFFGSWINR